MWDETRHLAQQRYNDLAQQQALWNNCRSQAIGMGLQNMYGFSIGVTPSEKETPNKKLLLLLTD